MFQAQSGSRYRALVVDDDRTSLELSCAMLENYGFIADRAHTGKQACLMCQTNIYDIIFMDIEMPQLDGYETTKNIRSLKKGSNHSYIIALSGVLATADQVQLCLNAGMNDCMTKPLRPKILQKKLLHWLKKIKERAS